MKTVIALKGRKGVGKTHSIRELYERLKIIYILENNEELFSEYIAKHKNEICRQFKINGVLCGFISVGDPSEFEFTTGVLNLFLQNGCQLIICACRTKSTTRQNVQRLSNNGYKIHFISVKEKSDNTIEVLLSEMVKFLNQELLYSMNFQCPDCGLDNAYFVLVDEDGSHYECPDCDYEWCDTSIGLEEEDDKFEDE